MASPPLISTTIYKLCPPQHYFFRNVGSTTGGCCAMNLSPSAFTRVWSRRIEKRGTPTTGRAARP